MASCAIKWCGKSAKTSSYQKDGITFHRFPKGPERKQKWIDTTCRGKDWFPSNNSVICSRHFTEDNFYIMKARRRLMDSAVPSLYLPVLAPAPIIINTCAGTSVKNSEPVAGTSSKIAISSSLLEDKKTSPRVTPTKQKEMSPTPGGPSAYDTPVKKRLCRRIIELTNVVKTKDKKIKKITDSNRRLKRQIVSLKSVLAELKKKIFLTPENNTALHSL